MLRTLDLLASDSSHLPFLYVFKESGVMENMASKSTFILLAAPRRRPWRTARSSR